MNNHPRAFLQHFHGTLFRLSMGRNTFLANKIRQIFLTFKISRRIVGNYFSSSLPEDNECTFFWYLIKNKLHITKVFSIISVELNSRIVGNYFSSYQRTMNAIFLVLIKNKLHHKGLFYNIKYVYN